MWVPAKLACASKRCCVSSLRDFLFLNAPLSTGASRFHGSGMRWEASRDVGALAPRAAAPRDRPAAPPPRPPGLSAVRGPEEAPFPRGRSFCGSGPQRPPAGRPAAGRTPAASPERAAPPLLVSGVSSMWGRSRVARATASAPQAEAGSSAAALRPGPGVTCTSNKPAAHRGFP